MLLCRWWAVFAALVAARLRGFSLRDLRFRFTSCACVSRLGFRFTVALALRRTHVTRCAPRLARTAPFLRHAGAAATLAGAGAAPAAALAAPPVARVASAAAPRARRQQPTGQRARTAQRALARRPGHMGHGPACPSAALLP